MSCKAMHLNLTKGKRMTQTDEAIERIRTKVDSMVTREIAGRSDRTLILRRIQRWITLDACQVEHFFMPVHSERLSSCFSESS